MRFYFSPPGASALVLQHRLLILDHAIAGGQGNAGKRPERRRGARSWSGTPMRTSRRPLLLTAFRLLCSSFAPKAINPARSAILKSLPYKVVHLFLLIPD